MTVPTRHVDDTLKRTNAETLSTGHRVGELISVIITLAVIGFFVQHLRMGTDFFTAAFGPWEQAYLYVPLLAALAAPSFGQRAGGATRRARSRSPRA